MSGKIDGVPRELLERVLRAGVWQSEAEELRALLAAPVVERQPSYKPVMTLEAERLWGGAGEYAFSVADHAWLDACRKEGGTFKLYTAPPELAELQATIAKLSKLLGQARGMVNGASDEWHNSVEKVLGHE